MRFKRPNVKIPDDYPEDLKNVIKLVDDLAFYRTTKDDGGLSGAAWIELRMAIKDLPERPGSVVVAYRGLTDAIPAAHLQAL
jgi:hypothetical protein